MVKQLKGDQLLEYTSVATWINSLDETALNRNKDKLTKNAKAVRLGRMLEYTDNGKLNPDELLQEAKDNIDDAGRRLKAYFDKKKEETSHNNALTAVWFLRGFYSHNDLVFPRKWALPKRQVSKVSKRDAEASFYQYNEKTDMIEFKNGNLQHFMQNLNFRDQTIALCLLSSGADATDVLKLKVGFIRTADGELNGRKRLFWFGNRAKTGQPFKTFFSEEATEFLKRYVKQEHRKSSDDELLFSKTNEKPYTARLLSINFRNAARRLHVTKKGQSNAFRPKRFRHLFRTACGIARIDNAFTMAMMGHASNVSDSYLEQDSSIFEKIYVKIEPLLTVFGANKVNEMSREISGLHDENLLLKEGQEGIAKRTEDLENQVVELIGLVNEQQGQLRSAIKYIATLKEELSDRDRAEAEEDFRQTVEEVNRTHPLAKKPKEVK